MQDSRLRRIGMVFEETAELLDFPGAVAAEPVDFRERKLRMRKVRRVEGDRGFQIFLGKIVLMKTEIREAEL